MGRDADTIILSQFIDALENAGLLDVDWDENWDMLDLYFHDRDKKQKKAGKNHMNKYEVSMKILINLLQVIGLATKDYKVFERDMDHFIRRFEENEKENGI
jgi:hypothetical protein